MGNPKDGGGHTFETRGPVCRTKNMSSVKDEYGMCSMTTDIIGEMDSVADKNGAKAIPTEKVHLPVKCVTEKNTDPAIFNTIGGFINTGGLPVGALQRRLEKQFGLSSFMVHTDAKADEFCNHKNADCCVFKNHLIFRKGAYDFISPKGKKLIKSALKLYIDNNPDLKGAANSKAKQLNHETHEEVLELIPLVGLAKEGKAQWDKAKKEAHGFDYIGLWLADWGGIEERDKSINGAVDSLTEAAVEDKIDIGCKTGAGFGFASQFKASFNEYYIPSKVAFANEEIIRLLVIVPLARSINERDTPAFNDIFTTKNTKRNHIDEYNGYVKEVIGNVQSYKEDCKSAKLSSQLNDIETCANEINPDSDEWKDTGNYGEWRKKYIKLYDLLENEKKNTEGSTEANIVAAYGKLGSVYHDIQDALLRGKKISLVLDFAVSVVAGGPAGAIGKGLLKAGGKALLKKAVTSKGGKVLLEKTLATKGGKASVDFVVNLGGEIIGNEIVSLGALAWGAALEVSDRGLYDGFGDKMLSSVKQDAVSSLVSSLFSAGLSASISTGRSLVKGEFNMPKSNTAAPASAKGPVTPPPLPKTAANVPAKGPSMPPPLPKTAANVPAKGPVTPPPLPKTAANVPAKGPSMPPPLPKTAANVPAKGPVTPPPLPKTAANVPAKGPSMPPPLPKTAANVPAKGPVTPPPLPKTAANVPAKGPVTPPPLPKTAANASAKGPVTPPPLPKTAANVPAKGPSMPPPLPKTAANVPAKGPSMPPPLPKTAANVPAKGPVTPPPLPKTAANVPAKGPSMPPPLPKTAANVPAKGPVTPPPLPKTAANVPAKGPVTPPPLPKTAANVPAKGPSMPPPLPKTAANVPAKGPSMPPPLPKTAANVPAKGPVTPPPLPKTAANVPAKGPSTPPPLPKTAANVPAKGPATVANNGGSGFGKMFEESLVDDINEMMTVKGIITNIFQSAIVWLATKGIKCVKQDLFRPEWGDEHLTSKSNSEIGKYESGIENLSSIDLILKSLYVEKARGMISGQDKAAIKSVYEVNGRKNIESEHNNNQSSAYISHENGDLNKAIESIESYCKSVNKRMNAQIEVERAMEETFMQMNEMRKLDEKSAISNKNSVLDLAQMSMILKLSKALEEFSEASKAEEDHLNLSNSGLIDLYKLTNMVD